MRIIPLDDAAISEVMKTLKKGGVVVFPSDTVYGLLCDAKNDQAIIRLQQFKNRPKGKPISVFVSDFIQMKSIVDISASQEEVLRSLLPGPYTIVFPSKHSVSRLLESEKNTLGVRIPFYKPITDLITLFKHPITATSANLSGQPPFYSIASFLKVLPDKKRELIDLVVDAGELPKNKPSTVLDFSTSTIKTLRKGDFHFNTIYTLLSSSEQETKQYAQKLLKDLLKKNPDKPLVFILKGDMGVGKTIFTKGLGAELGIQNIISPTYVIYYEYKTHHPAIDTFLHCDLFNIEEEAEFHHLGLEKYFIKGTVLCFEWGEKSGFLLSQFKKNAHVIVIHTEHKGISKRLLTIEQHTS